MADVPHRGETLLKTLQTSLFLGLALAGLVAAGCSQITVDRTGRPCAADGTCIDGYQCNPVSNICEAASSLCVDADGDGYGEGPGCTGPDCDDASAACNVDCTSDVDGNSLRDCDHPCTDIDADDVCDAIDTCIDVDGDGLGDGTGGNTGCEATTTDSDDTNASVCGDTDGDTCEDCTSGHFAPANDGTDTNGDGICDAAGACHDLDRDGLGDGTGGNVGCLVTTVDSNDNDPNACADNDGDSCDDCSGGSYDPSADGPDGDADGICDAGDDCTDADGDGYGTGTLANAGCTGSADDCNDADNAIHPGATEICDAANVDEDCNGVADDADVGATGKSSYYPDSDGDTYGRSSASPTAYCDPPTGWVADNTDCNDTSSAIHPGATEVCDAADVDENCNGVADDADSGATGKSTFYADVDGDTYGNAASTSQRCDPTAGWVSNSSDCNDASAAINPAATEVCDAANVDENCNNLADDADPGTNAATKTTYYPDGDLDTYGDVSSPGTLYCDPPAGYVADHTDCDDTDTNNWVSCGSCVDVDGDLSFVGCDRYQTIAGPDCNDSNSICTTDCTACLPTSLTLSATTPVAACGVSDLTLYLDGVAGAASALTCSAPAQFLHQAVFSVSSDDGWTDQGVSTNDVVLRGWPNSFPATCPQINTDYFERFNDVATDSFMQLGTPIDATGYTDLSLSFLIGYRNTPPAGQHVNVLYCCGAGCTTYTLLGSVPNANDGGAGTDDCRTATFALPPAANACASLMLRFEFPHDPAGGTGRAGLDNIDVTGTPAFGAIADVGSGTYTSTLQSCVATTIDATCTWNDGTHAPLTSNTASVVFP